MSIPVAAANLLLDKLRQVRSHRSHLIADVNDNISRLERAVGNIKELMMEMCRYHSDSETLKQTVKEIRDLLYDAEDAVDNYLIQASVKKSRSGFSKVLHKVTDDPAILRDMDKNIAAIAEKVKQINEDKLRTGFEVLQYLSITSLDPSSKPPTNCGKTDYVTGFDEPARKVADLLTTESDEDLEVISIAGMGGLGKTTLAKKVYQEVADKFDIRAFVYVSEECDRKEVLLQLLDCFTKSESLKKMNEEELEKHVTNLLKANQYLVVLDDVWEARDWDKYWKHVFPTNVGKTSRVLITTRNARVAEHVNPGNSSSLYRLECLSDECSAELLMKTVFPENGSSVDPRHEEQARRIAPHCKGLPMAVVLVGGVLTNDLSPKWWDHVEGCLTRDGWDLLKVIEMAYEHLYNHLKSCFLYLGMFCENSVIHVWKLVRLWVAEGFIEEKADATMEDTAMIYLEQLVQRSLVTVEERSSNGKVKYCRIHTLLRDFCKIKAIEEKVFLQVKLENPKSDEGRRLCISANVKDYISSQLSGPLVRSLLAFGKKEEDVDSKTFSAIPKTFKLLRVLEAQSLTFSSFPTDLNLILLKYLAISSTTSSLPQELSSLWNLQTLRVRTTLPALVVSADIWNMPQFRHFHSNVPATLPNSDTKSLKSSEESLSKSRSSRYSSQSQQNKSESAAGNNIQTLSTVAPESWVSDQAPKLRKLGICGDLSKHFKEDGKSSLHQLKDLTSLECLKLQSNGEGNPVPGLLKHLPLRLTKLTLVKTRLKWEEMTALRSLESLAVLKLKESAFEGSRWETVDGCFSKLEYLAIGQQTDLEVWMVSAAHFPMLRNLKLDGINEAISIALMKGVFHDRLDLSVVIYCVHPSDDLKTLCNSSSNNFQLIQRIKATAC